MHAFTPKAGIFISNALGGLKLLILFLIVSTGFAALAGHVTNGKPDNFSSFNGNGTACDLPPYADEMKAANYAIALLQVCQIISEAASKVVSAWLTLNLLA